MNTAQSVQPKIIPTIGRVVLYCLSEQDAEQINRRRTTGHSIAERIREDAFGLNELLDRKTTTQRNQNEQ